MNTRSSNRRAGNVIASVLLIMGASAAFAADPPAADHGTPSKEMREKMASLHEQMAACLRSDKPIADCRSQMMKSCEDTMGEKGCPMMGHGMMGSGPGKRNHMTPHAAKDDEDHK
jgi:hypothetical protein